MPLLRGRVRYHPGMSKLLLNLRDVPDDEADDVRRFLDSGGIGYYETRPNMWGIAGAFGSPMTATSRKRSG